MKGYIRPPAKQSYPCPLPYCNRRKYERLADHLAATHNLGGTPCKNLMRRKLVGIAHSEELLEQNIEWLAKLPRKFQGDNYSII